MVQMLFCDVGSFLRRLRFHPIPSFLLSHVWDRLEVKALSCQINQPSNHVICFTHTPTPHVNHQLQQKDPPSHLPKSSGGWGAEVTVFFWRWFIRDQPRHRRCLRCGRPGICLSTHVVSNLSVPRFQPRHQLHRVTPSATNHLFTCRGRKNWWW